MPVIFFEGADGSGKDSLIDNLYDHYHNGLHKDVKIYNDGYGLTYPEEYSNLIKRIDHNDLTYFGRKET